MITRYKIQYTIYKGGDIKLRKSDEKILKHFTAVKRGWNRFIDLYGKDFKPPYSASLQDLKNYKKVASPTIKTGGSILILGMTPPLRNLLHNHNGQIFVADFAWRALKLSTKLFINPVVAKKENRLCVSWYDLPEVIQPESVDLAMGDLITRPTPPDLIYKLLKTVRILLKPGAIFVTRVNIHNPAFKKNNPGELIKLILEDKNIPENQRAAALNYALTDRLKDKTHLAEPARVIKELQRAAKNSVLEPKLREIIEKAKHNRSMLNFGRSVLPREVFEKQTKKLFIIKNILFADDYSHSRFFPLYVLKKTR